MSFMLKKKKYKFKVDLVLQELSAVPFVNGILFAKIRLVDGGTFTESSQKQEVKNNCVKWDTKFQFGCKMTANASTGVLEPCICRVSVRKEIRGGRSFEKLGFANMNLAEFAGAGLTSRRYLLEGYDSKHRQDNSMLQITIEMFLLAGDPCFKTPSVRAVAPLRDKPQIQLPADKKGEDYSGDSLASGSSGFGSLPRKQRPNLLSSELVTGSNDEKSKEDDHVPEFERGHSRNSSYASQHSKASGYGSLASHSRQSSAESGHHRNPSSSSTFSELCLAGVPKAPDRKRPSKKQMSDEGRMDSTRVSAKEVINEVIEATNLEPDDSMESPGLILFIKNDGTPALSSHELPDCPSGHFDQVVIAHR
ncbi:protein FAM102A-like isoform X1 [Stegodyphus dumicola]|uniref:protein FAM102A-like isoform X1 n=1 Tax=Stegodyphus dumicola TaxID=202533 RepID=UPI0015AD6538|nr:protein FAM102A-like isoform X1 [Stegodyphus dumicola]